MRGRVGMVLAVLLAAEIIVFIVVGNWIGVGWTILLALVTSAIGLWLFGREGVRALRALGEAARGGAAAGAAAVDTGLIALGGLLVFLPGFVSDVVGLLCLIPATRPLIRRLVIGGVARKYGPARVRSRRLDGGRPRGVGERPGQTGTAGRHGPATSGQDVIEGEIVP